MTLGELKERLTAIDAELADILAELDAEPTEEPAEEPAEGEGRSTTEALEERSNKLIEERQNIMAEIEKAEKTIAEEKRAMEEVKAEKNIKPVEVREEKPKMEIRNTTEYINAFAEYIKSEDATECRTLISETNSSSGGVPVPDLVYDIVKTAWENDGVTSRVRKAYVKGNLKVGFEAFATPAEIHDEGNQAPPDEETLNIGIVTLIPASIKKWITISDEVYDLRGEEFLRYIYDELTYQIAKRAAEEVIIQIEACGTIATTNAVGVPKFASSTVNVGLVAQAMSLLSDEAANPVVMMNKATWGAFKAAQYANGFDVDPFEGLPVVFNNTIQTFAAATTGDTYAIVGDLDHGALMNFPNGDEIRIKFDDLSMAESDMIKIVGREFVGVGIVADKAFVKIVK